MYLLQRYPFSGLDWPREEFESLADVRRAVARYLRSQRRAGRTVSTLMRGNRWEVIDSDDAVMVSDYAGIVSADWTAWECSECGCEHAWRDDAAACCAEFAIHAPRRFERGAELPVRTVAA